MHAEQVGPALALPLNAILHPPTATVHTDTTSSSTQDGRTEGGKEGPGEEESTERRMKLASSIRRRGAWRQRRRGGDNWTGGRRRGGGGEKDGGGGGEEEAPVLSGAVCFCLYVCSHTVEINLPSGLSLWNKERRKLARSDTLREKWRKTKTGNKEARWSLGGVQEWRGGAEVSGNLPGPTCSCTSKHNLPYSGRLDFQFPHQHFDTHTFAG